MYGMAAAHVSQSEADCTCPVCCDIFKDPVVLLCGHSFCKVCLQEWWRKNGKQTCPVCMEIFPMAHPPPRNLALGNLLDNLRLEKRRADDGRSSSIEMCSLHSEKLKLFCEDDQQLICVICRDAQQHKKHNCVPINEAAEPRRTKLRAEVKHMTSNLGLFLIERANCNKLVTRMELQAQQMEMKIKQEFQKLYQVLQAEKAERIDAVRREANYNKSVMTIRMSDLAKVTSSLTKRIATIQGQLRAKDIAFMRNVKSTMGRSQCNLLVPKTPSGTMIEEAKHLENLLFAVWTKMKSIIPNSKQCGGPLPQPRPVPKATVFKHKPLPAAAVAPVFKHKLPLPAPAPVLMHFLPPPLLPAPVTMVGPLPPPPPAD